MAFKESRTIDHVSFSDSEHRNYLAAIFSESSLPKEFHTPQYALAFACERIIKQRYTNSADQDRIVAKIGQVMIDFKNRKPRDNGVPYVLHVIDSLLNALGQEPPEALREVTTFEDFREIIEYDSKLVNEKLIDEFPNITVEMAIAVLMHDHIEDLGFSREMIAESEGELVAIYVDGLSKLSSGELKKIPKAKREAESVKRQIFATSDHPEIPLLKLISDFRSNVKTLQYLKDKDGESAEMRQKRKGTEYLRFAQFMLECHIPGAREMIDICFSYADVDNYDIAKKVFDKYRDDITEFTREFAEMNSNLLPGFLQAEEWYRSFNAEDIDYRVEIPSVFEIHKRLEQLKKTRGQLDYRVICAPSVYVCCPDSKYVRAYTHFLSRAAFKDCSLDAENAPLISDYGTIDAREVWVSRRSGVQPRFKLYVPSREYLFIPLNHLTKASRNPHEDRMRAQLMARYSHYLRAFSSRYSPQVQLAIFNEEAGRELMQVQLSDSVSIFLVRGSSVLDLAVRASNNADDPSFDAGLVVGARRWLPDTRVVQLNSHNDMLLDGDQVELLIDPKRSYVPTVEDYLSARTFDGKDFIYRKCVFLKRQRRIGVNISELNMIIDSFELEYGDRI